MRGNDWVGKNDSFVHLEEEEEVVTLQGEELLEVWLAVVFAFQGGIGTQFEGIVTMSALQVYWGKRK